MSNYKESDKDQSYDKEVRESNWVADNSVNQNKTNSENNASKKNHFGVLNEDGSLPDLPDQDVPGKGAGDGTVGAG